MRLVYAGDIKAVCLKDQEDMDAFAEALQELCYFDRKGNTVRIDTRAFKDPEDARKLSGHWGYHPEIMKGLWGQTVSGDLKVMAKFLRDAFRRPQSKTK